MEMQNGLLVAPRLNELPSKAEVEKAIEDKVDAVGIDVTFPGSGALLQHPAKIKLAMLSNTEVLRARIDI